MTLLSLQNVQSRDVRSMTLAGWRCYSRISSCLKYDRTVFPCTTTSVVGPYSAENPHSSECLACVPESHSVQLLLTRNCTLSFRKITRGFTVSPTVYSVGFSAPSRRRRRSDVGSLANGEGAAFLLPPLLHGRELTCAAGVCLAGECQDGRYDRGYGEGRNRACLLCDE